MTAAPAATPAAQPAAGAAEGSAGADPAGSDPAASRDRSGLLALLHRPLASYYLLLGIVALLLALGLVMVLSTSSAIALQAGVSPYSGFVKQLGGVLVGTLLMWTLSKASPALFRAFAYPLLLVSVVGLVLVLAVGTTVGGAARWVQIAGIQLQPSELAKLSFLLWGADLLARKERLGQLTDWRMLLIPLLPGVAVLALLVMLGDDLGTTFMMLIIFMTLLWVVGTPGRMFLGLLALMGFMLLVLIVVAPYRWHRLSSFVNPVGGPTGPNMQAIQGRWALGSGGLFGVGLGASREKWGWLPASSTDFIFAILGEELGLVGTLCVVLLYSGLAYTGLRIARRVSDTFMRLAAAGATAWIVAQAVVNMGSVLGLLPITGVPLPLVSQGLSSLLATMAALGMLLSFARREPGAAQALAGRPGIARRVLGWVGLRPGPGAGVAGTPSAAPRQVPGRNPGPRQRSAASGPRAAPRPRRPPGRGR
jgi:cell division protein FtsW